MLSILILRTFIFIAMKGSYMYDLIGCDCLLRFRLVARRMFEHSFDVFSRRICIQLSVTSVTLAHALVTGHSFIKEVVVAPASGALGGGGAATPSPAQALHVQSCYSMHLCLSWNAGCCVGFELAVGQTSLALQIVPLNHDIHVMSWCAIHRRIVSQACFAAVVLSCYVSIVGVGVRVVVLIGVLNFVLMLA